MLYYTSKNQNGEIEATYSGRFAFIHFKQQQDYEAIHSLRKGNDLKNLWMKGHEPDVNSAIRILAHEYTHKNIFSLSKTGLVLNGYRFWVRIRFLVSKSTRCLADYYRMRAIYFMETRSYHEKLASAIDAEIDSSNASIEKVFKKAVKHHYQDTIHLGEERIRDKWKAMGFLPGIVKEKLCYFFGRWLQENFAIKLSYRDKCGKWVHGSFADQGITNDIHTIRSKENWFARVEKTVLSNFFVRPLVWLENFDNRFEWYWIGQRAQFQVLQEKYDMDYQYFWENILCPNAFFIMEWAGIPMRYRHTLMEFSEDTLLLDRDAFMSKWEHQLDQWKRDHDVLNYINFFYQHGN